MVLVDGHGIPLSLIVIGANRHDVSQLGATLDAVMVPRPLVTPGAPQHLCADAGFVGDPALHEMLMQNYTPHVRPRGEERTERARGTRPRRWVVEVAHSWFNRFRKLLVRYEKTHRAYVALTMLAAAIICFRNVPGRINIIYG
jgi:transposase